MHLHARSGLSCSYPYSCNSARNALTSSLSLRFYSTVLPTMNASKPALFVNITPVSPDGVTVVDLGGEMGQDVPVIRHSSLPPSPTRAEYGDSMSGVRHGSLPPPSKQPKMKILSSVEDSIEEMSDDSEGAGATEPPQNSSTLGVQVNPAMVS